MTAIRGAFVPGMPHLLTGQRAYEPLTTALEQLGVHWARQGIKRILYFSTQWRSVLGHMFLAGPSGQGVHVDDNWYDLTEIPYDITVDPTLAHRLADAAISHGFQTKVIDYHGFPVDTGTLVVDRILNNRKFMISAVSCSIYSDYQDTAKLAQSFARLLSSEYQDTAVVVVSALSGRTLNREVILDDEGQVCDEIASDSDERFNRRCLEMISAGSTQALHELLQSESPAHLVDMGLRGMAFLEGLGIWGKNSPGEVKAYGPLHGTGGAVVYF